MNDGTVWVGFPKRPENLQGRLQVEAWTRVGGGEAVLVVPGHTVSTVLVPVLPWGTSGQLHLGCECVHVLDQLMAWVLDGCSGHQPPGSQDQCG